MLAYCVYFVTMRRLKNWQSLHLYFVSHDLQEELELSSPLRCGALSA